MKGNLWEKYKNLDESYYHIPIGNNEQLLGREETEQDFSADACRAFIKKHFDGGNKLEAMELPFKYEWEQNGKHQHTVALYLMGLVLEKAFNNSLHRNLSKIIADIDSCINCTGYDKKWKDNSKGWYDYRYTWFLTCLYHDTASCIESSEECYCLIEQKKQIDFFLESNDVQYTPYTYTPAKPNVSLTRFSEELIKNYFSYRMDNGCLDHGIVAGYLLFDKLHKNFNKKTCGHDWKTTPVKEYTGDDHFDLKYRLTHLDHFAHIADAIICHNLWMSYDDATDEKYRKYGLNPLIVKDNPGNVLSLSSHPLQFMLCLLDTIEPIKRFASETMSAQEVLENIFIKAKNNNPKGIAIAWTEKLRKQEKFYKWLGDIQELPKWMRVAVSSCRHSKGGDCCVEITFE